ncbi:unnamed protein product, partial [marine sediment metagenome]
MGLKDKSTYGEYFWAMQVEAQDAFDENIEDAISPYFRAVMNDFPELYDLPSGMRSLFSAMAEPPSAGFGDLIKLTGGEFAAEVIKDAVEPAMKMMKRQINKRSKETWLTTPQANKLFREGKINEDYWSLITESEGYERIIGKNLYESEMPYPSIPDLILYA